MQAFLSSQNAYNPVFNQLIGALLGVLQAPNKDQLVAIKSSEEILLVLTDLDVPKSEEMKAAETQLVKTVVKILIMQGEANALTQENLAALSKIFADFDAAKISLIMEFERSASPYYDAIKKLLIKNLAAWQLKNIIEKSVTAEEVSDMPWHKIERILKKIRDKADSYPEKDELLREEQKTAETYNIVMSKQILANNIKALMESLTDKLNNFINPGAEETIDVITNMSGDKK